MLALRGFQALGSVKRLETIVLLWRYINKIELSVTLSPMSNDGENYQLDAFLVTNSQIPTACALGGILGVQCAEASC